MSITETSSAHTEGPWHAGVSLVFDNQKRAVCELQRLDRSQEELQANSDLIAAAPELLEACKLAFKKLKPKGDIKKDFEGHVAIAALSSAIHNAENKFCF